MKINTAIANAAHASLIVDESGTVLFAAEPACKLLGYAPSEVKGQSVELLVPERLRLAHIGHRLRFTDAGRTRPMPSGHDFAARRSDGSELAVHVGLCLLHQGLQTFIIVRIERRDDDTGPANESRG